MVGLALTALIGCGGSGPSPRGEASSTDAGPPPSARVQIFLIALADGGQAGRLVGCGDSVVPITVMIEPGGSRLENALRALLDFQREALGGPGLSNALFRSRLWLEAADVRGRRAEVRIGGQLALGGTCDPPRIRAQLEETVLQFEGIDEVEIYINGRPLDEALQRRGPRRESASGR